MPAPRAASAPSRPGATRSRPPACDTIARLVRGARPGAVGLLPRRHVPGHRCAPACRPRATTTAARVDEACRTECAVPGAGGRRPARRARRARRRTRTSRWRARAGARRHRRAAGLRARSAACRWRSSRCIRCTPPTAPASTRWSRRSTSATQLDPRAQRRARRGRRRLPRVVGPEAAAQIARAGKERLLALPRLRLARRRPPTC